MTVIDELEAINKALTEIGQAPGTEKLLDIYRVLHGQSVPNRKMPMKDMIAALEDPRVPIERGVRPGDH